jgi:hypothetical protein
MSKATLIGGAIGAVAGLASGISVVYKPPLGVILPGILFGIAYCVAMKIVAPARMSLLRALGVIIGATIGYFVSGIVALVTDHIPVPSGWPDAAVAGLLGSVVGSSIFLVAAIVCDAPPLQPARVVIPFWGAVIAILFPISVAISDDPNMGHPIDGFVFFILAHGIVLAMLMTPTRQPAA